MSKIRVRTPDGKEVDYDETEFAWMSRRNLFPAGTMYQRKEKKAWRPVQELTPRRPDKRSMDSPSVSSRSLILLLILVAVICGLSIWSDVMQADVLLGRLEKAVVQENDQRQAALFLSLYTLVLATGIVFLVWIYGANRTCRELGASLQFSPGWCVGCFFVPMIQLIRPWQAMREIWQASHDPTGKSKEGGHGVLFCWILSNPEGMRWRSRLRPLVI